MIVRPKFWRQWCWVLLAAVLTSACGYRVVGSEPPEGGHVPTLAIPPFENRSTEVGLETIFANDFLRAFGQSRVTRVRPGEDGELILHGTLRQVESSSVAYADIDVSLVRRVTMVVDFVLKDKHGKTVWKDTEVIYADYVVDPNYHIGETTRHQAIRRASASLAQRVHDKILTIL